MNNEIPSTAPQGLLDQENLNGMIDVEIYTYIPPTDRFSLIQEKINMKFDGSRTINDIIKEGIINFNAHFANNQIPAKFKPNALNYEMVEHLKEDEEEMNVDKIPVEKLIGYQPSFFQRKTILRREELNKTKITKFNLIYSPQDIMINFSHSNSKGLCTWCCVI